MRLGMHIHGIAWSVVLCPAAFGQCTLQWMPHAGGAGLNDAVNRIAIWNGDLVAAGKFTIAGGQRAAHIARWDGAAWHPLGAGVSGTAGQLVHAIQPYRGRLIVGGEFTSAGGSAIPYLAAWDGASWSTLGSGVSNDVWALLEFDGALIVGGSFGQAGGVAGTIGIARWDGSQWSSLGGGMAGGGVIALAHFSGDLVAGGQLSHAGGVFADGIAIWNGATWQGIGLGMSGFEASLWDLIEFRGDLIECGLFVAAPKVARWTGGHSWAPLAGGPALPLTMATFRDRLYIGGGLQPTLASWDGTTWSTVSTTPFVWDLLPHEGELLVAGQFTGAGIPSPYLARWGCLCYPDCNNSGDLTVADFGCFQSQFVGGDPYADCNSDGTLSVQDFGCFQSRFVTGCP